MDSAAGAALKPMLDTVFSTATKVTDDIKNASWVIGVCILVCVFIGLIYMLFLRLFAGLLVFLTIVAYLVGMVFLGSMLMAESTEKKEDGTNQDYYKYIAYTVWGIAGLSAIFFCCFRNALKLAVAIVKSAGMFLMDCKTVLLVPLLGQVLFLVIFCFWLVGFIYIYSMGTPQRMTSYPFNKFAASDE
jgi:hypothetical protein